jgi:hypothetical protein
MTMARNIALFSMAAVCLVACLHAQESNDRTPKEKSIKPKDDICTISFKFFVPSFKKNIEKETAPGSTIRKAALEALSSAELQKGTFKVTTRKVGDDTLVSEKVAIEPASGTIVLEGMKWKWEIAGTVGDVEIYGQPPPAFAHFEFTPRFVIHSLQEPARLAQVGGEDTGEGGFYIIYGGGSEQDATKRPKNAPALRKKR